MAEARIYQVFAGKTRRSRPHIIHRSVKGQKKAIELAKAYHEKYPDRFVGVFEVERIRVFKPKKK